MGQEDQLRSPQPTDIGVSPSRTNEFDAVHAQLRSNGVVFETYPIEGNFGSDEGPPPYWDDGALVFPDGEKTAWFKDSEGNILALGSSD